MGITWNNIPLTDNTFPVGVHLILGTLYAQAEKRKDLIIYVCCLFQYREGMNSIGPPTFRPSLDYVKIIEIPF